MNTLDVAPVAKPPVERRSPFAFFALLAALWAPLPVVGHFLQSSGLPKNMPVTDFAMAFTPAIAALILTYRAGGSSAVKALLGRILDFRRIGGRGWLLTAVCLPVAVLALTYALVVVTGVKFQSQPAIPVTAAVLFSAAFLIAAAGEELGWSGYVLEPMQRRWGALGGSVLLGTVWWGFHVPSILQSGQTSTLIVLGFVGAIGTRVVWSWLFNNAGGSVFAMVVVHAVSNFCGSYVPAIPTSATAPVIVVLAVIVTVVYGPRTLTRTGRLPAS